MRRHGLFYMPQKRSGDAAGISRGGPHSRLRCGPIPAKALRTAIDAKVQQADVQGKPAGKGRGQFPIPSALPGP